MKNWQLLPKCTNTKNQLFFFCQILCAFKHNACELARICRARKPYCATAYAHAFIYKKNLKKNPFPPLSYTYYNQLTNLGTFAVRLFCFVNTFGFCRKSCYFSCSISALLLTIVNLAKIIYFINACIERDFEAVGAGVKSENF